MPLLIDSHAHIDDDSFAADRADVLARARAAGVRHLIVPAVDQRSWARMASIDTHPDKDHPQTHPAYGLHPVYLHQHRPEHLHALVRQLETQRAIAVGEIGLDFFLTALDPMQQRDYFQQQLRIARDMDLPVILHARRAVDEVTAAIKRIGGLRGVVHSFSGSLQQAQRLWELGFHLGIGGPVTYPRAQRLRGIVAAMPIQWLLLETDSPDQPDAAHPGQRNEPARLTQVLRTVALLRGTSEAAVAATTTANACRLFNLTEN